MSLSSEPLRPPEIADDHSAPASEQPVDSEEEPDDAKIVPGDPDGAADVTEKLL